MTASAFCAVAPVSAVCAAFATQPSAYPLEQKAHVAPACGSVAGRQAQEKSAYGRLWGRCGGEAGEKGLALFCASPSTSARSAGSFER